MAGPRRGCTKRSRKSKRRAHKQQTLTLPTGLTFKAAWRMAVARARRDFRGMRYDPTTGRAVLV